MLRMRLRRVEEGRADALCGRGGCGTTVGQVNWSGLGLKIGTYRGPAEFYTLPGMTNKGGTISLSTRAARQWRNRRRIPGSSVEPAAWGRRPPRGGEGESWEEIIAVASGQPSSTSDRRLPPLGPLYPPVQVKCPACGYINIWDGSTP